jgi:predicted nucleotide-binding protein
MSKSQGTILFVEDELSVLQQFTQVLRRRGYRVLAVSDPDEALAAITAEHRLDLLLIDLQLPLRANGLVNAHESAGGKEAGLVIAKEARRKFRRLPVIFWSMRFAQGTCQRIRELGNAYMVSKQSGSEAVEEILDDVLEGFNSGKRPRAFIVHGHDEGTMESLRKYLQDNLGFPEPVILRNMPSHGRAIIDKLESYALTIDLVFVLLTPDDKVVSSGLNTAEVYRSRQNVIFELGYFFGVMGRTTGRVLLLYKQPIELPSDIEGLIKIDITCGVESADGEIRREISEWIRPESARA